NELANELRTPDEIDDIISAELTSPMHDPNGYKVVAEYMLHRPCGKDVKYAPCTFEGKCSKHFLKAFLRETIIDEDGYYKTPKIRYAAEYNLWGATS
nr:uncharacterized protein [Tanacetum cinerariifolium]